MQSAKESLAHGDLENARLLIDSARGWAQGFTGDICDLETSAVDLQIGRTYDKSVRRAISLDLIEKINKSWQDIAVWYDSIISSVGEEELLRSAEDGIISFWIGG